MLPACALLQTYATDRVIITFKPDVVAAAAAEAEGLAFQKPAGLNGAGVYTITDGQDVDSKVKQLQANPGGSGRWERGAKGATPWHQFNGMRGHSTVAMRAASAASVPAEACLGGQLGNQRYKPAQHTPHGPHGGASLAQSFPSVGGGAMQGSKPICAGSHVSEPPCARSPACPLLLQPWL